MYVCLMRLEPAPVSKLMQKLDRAARISKISPWGDRFPGQQSWLIEAQFPCLPPRVYNSTFVVIWPWRLVRSKLMGRQCPVSLYGVRVQEDCDSRKYLQSSGKLSNISKTARNKGTLWLRDPHLHRTLQLDGCPAEFLGTTKCPPADPVFAKTVSEPIPIPCIPRQKHYKERRVGSPLGSWRGQEGNVSPFWAATSPNCRAAEVLLYQAYSMSELS